MPTFALVRTTQGSTQRVVCHTDWVPLRDQLARDICGFCQTLAAAHCQRCATPLCSQHQHNENTRCAGCAPELTAALARAEGVGKKWEFYGWVLSFVSLFAATVCMGTGAVSAYVGIAWLLLNAVPMILTAISGDDDSQLLLERNQRERNRRLFLKEQKRLPATSTEVSQPSH